MIRLVQVAIASSFVVFYLLMGFAWIGLGGSIVESVFVFLLHAFWFVVLYVLFWSIGKYISRPIIKIIIAGVLSFVVPLIIPIKHFYLAEMPWFARFIPILSAFLIYVLQISISLSKQGFTKKKIAAIFLACVIFSAALVLSIKFIERQAYNNLIQSLGELLSFSELSDKPLLSSAGEPIGLIISYSFTPSKDYWTPSDYETPPGLSTPSVRQNIEPRMYINDLLIFHHVVSPDPIPKEDGKTFEKDVVYTVTMYAVPSYQQNSDSDLQKYLVDDSILSFGNNCIQRTYVQRVPSGTPESYIIDLSFDRVLYTENKYSANEFYKNLQNIGMELCPER